MITKKNKREFRLLGVLTLIGMAILLLNILTISSVGEVSYCAEKTTDGAWCQNVPLEKVDKSVNPGTGQPYRSAPTSCEATSYCKLGYCYDSQEGTCLPNVPQVVCNDAEGTWNVGNVEPPQCSLGCCVLGDQASFVTQVRCKKLSAVYGLETNFRTDFSSESECLASVTSDVEGACVFERDFETTCQRLTQKECLTLQGNAEGSVSFHEGMLCSADQLGTNCGATRQTTCVEYKDGVYFVDSCGNIANIYDSQKADNKDYWTYIKTTSESCSPSSVNGNAGSSTCGNCDYYLGSTCKQYDRNVDTRASPQYGDYICRDLSCVWEGERYKHGETWCQTNTERENSPGSEYFRLVCYNSEVTVENCAAFRQEVCISDTVNTPNGDYRVAACRANLWQDCIAQDNEKDCKNTDQRDCDWVTNGEKQDGEDVYVCVPENPPGLNFWEEGDSDEICSVADTSCIATLEKGIGDVLGIGDDKWECDNSKSENNCHCCVNDPDGDGEDENKGCTGISSWEADKMKICTAMGDCGVKYNYVGSKGFYNESELISFA